ncbi:MAG: catalase [Miltoncostaeaceae bacterium]|nr:catalase [Miltoncostaeaceae bacterium]
MRYEHAGGQPMYAPNSYGGPRADARFQEPGCHVSGEMVRAAYSERRDDDDFVQARALYRTVMDEAARRRLVSNIAGHLRQGVEAKVLAAAVHYWTSVDAALGARVAVAVGRPPAGDAAVPDAA